jgi:hypothetical protein
MALKNLVKMVLSLDPTDEDRPQVKHALRILNQSRHTRGFRAR